MSFVSHVALYAQGGGLQGAAIDAFMPYSDLHGQVSHEALHVYYHLWIRNGHPVHCAHVIEVRFEAGVVACEAPAAEQTLEGR